jgi:DNA repair protein RecN (Recombination protein N)
MLTSLRIKNLALVADLTLDLAPGYNVITGETGAGKSILLGALTLLLGERADRTLLRSGTDQCTVEGLFELARPRATLLDATLQSHGFEPEANGQLLVKRTFTAGGANRQFINGSPATLALLEEIGALLVDMHGPHEHQSLLRPQSQLDILDSCGGLGKLRDGFAALVRRRLDLEQQKTALVIDDHTYAQELDLLRHQVREIQGAKLHPDEEPELEVIHQRLSNTARLQELAHGALDQLSESDVCLLSAAGQLGRSLQEIRRLDPETDRLTSQHDDAVSLWRELQTELSHYLDHLEADPARLQEVEERLDLLQSLKRKYGRTLEDVLRRGDEAAARLRSLEGREAELERLHQEIALVLGQLNQVGRQLSARRRETIARLRPRVQHHLAALGFAQSHFDVNLHTLDAAPADAAALKPHGLDEIEFEFAPNPGEPPRPLRAIASSGELARVMLALKTTLAAQDAIPVLVFDEVDANIGGETAHAVGEKMRQIAEQHQVLCVTHLAPVAASASAHFAVTKHTQQGRTFTEIRRLTPAERLDELARMLGGNSPAARQHAAALLRDTADAPTMQPQMDQVGNQVGD